MNKSQAIVDELLNNKSAIVITSEGEMTEVSPKDKYFTLEELYKHINCDIIECVYLPENKIMIVDEEGMLKKRQLNLLATLIVSHIRKNFVIICGDVVIINENQFE